MADPARSAPRSAAGTLRSGADTARRATRSEMFRRLARLGHVANGILHVLIGLLAFDLARGGGGDADQSGAAGLLAANPAGLVLLWITVAGCASLAVWHLAAVVWGGDETLDRVKDAGKAVVFAAVASTFAAAGVGAGRDSGEATRSFTATLLEHPAGATLLVAIGLVIVGIGGHHIHKGMTRRFAKDLTSPSREDVSRALAVTGVVGYTAKGIVLALVGALFVLAVVQHDPSQSTGMDGALKTLLAQPFGPWLLGAVGLGLVLYGVYEFLRSRYDRMPG